jgi:hypothetical protein
VLHAGWTCVLALAAVAHVLCVLQVLLAGRVCSGVQVVPVVAQSLVQVLAAARVCFGVHVLPAARALHDV